MAARTDSFDLGRLGLRSGEARRLDLTVGIEPLEFGGQRYEARPANVAATLDVTRTGAGYSLRLRYAATLSGPCARCLQDAGSGLTVDAREVDQPGGGDELSSPYVLEGEELDLQAWARDALVLELPAQILHAPDCAGLCPVCGKDLNVEPHEHEKPPDPRWDKLRGLLEERS